MEMTNKQAIEQLKIDFAGEYERIRQAKHKAIQALEKQEKIKEIINKRDNAFVGQEFGASYSDLDNIIEEIRNVIAS